MTIQAPGEPLLDNESTRGDERVSVRRMRCREGKGLGGCSRSERACCIRPRVRPYFRRMQGISVEISLGATASFIIFRQMGVT